MATQRLTIAKIGGQAAAATLDQFRAWHLARLVTTNNEWASEQWPQSVRQSADAWAETLREHAHYPPVVFFAEYVDLWSHCPPDRYLRDRGLIQIMADRYELFCAELPLSESAAATLGRIRAEGQHDEDRFFGTVTLEAASAWEALVESAVLVFLRHVIGASVSDAELSDSLRTIPTWVIS